MLFFASLNANYREGIIKILENRKIYTYMRIVSKIKHIIGKRYNISRLLYGEYKLLLKELGSSDTEDSKEKFKEQLIMQAHIIEKGLSLKDTRVGFGVPKVTSLLSSTKRYYNRYKDEETLYFILSVVKSYICFNEKQGEVNQTILGKYNELNALIADNEKYIHLAGGTFHVNKADILEKASIDYEGFVKSRHSIRNFTGKLVDMNLVRKAFEIAEYTPSACNRQPWKNYVFTSKEKIIELLDFQTGARQFKDDIACLILVTATPNAFFGGEYHQHFVNGGLYAMNLMFALHSMGLGTIPLNMGLEKTKDLNKHCDIKPSEVPIVLIAVGDISDQLEVACSRRFPYTEYTIFE